MTQHHRHTANRRAVNKRGMGLQQQAAGHTGQGNPDIGLAGTPSTYSAALAVGSVDNDGYEMYYITVNGVEYGFMDNATSSVTNFLANFRDAELEYVVVPGVGAVEDYEGLDVTGKVVLVSRGEIAFTEKQANAAEMGAIAVIVYNNDRGPFGMVITEGGIPAVSIDREAGAALIAAAGEDGVGTLKVCNADSKVFKIPQTISSFSSWGVTPDLKLKPEISGVGGSIYATRDPELTGAYYGYMSGTSMATPQIAGAMAVLIQYLDENYPEITGAEQRIMAANILMSTANPVMYNDLYEYSPRAQGAGLADLVKATTTAAYLSVPTASESRPKVEFGDDPERTGVYTFSFTITNISDETVSYTFDSSVLTEQIYSGWFIANAPYGLEAKVSVPELVEVPAGETVTVEAQLVLTDNDKAYLNYFPNGIYVEGYLYANPTNEDGVTLAMPMVGFYGDWSDAPVFDDDTMSGMYLGSYSLYPRMVYTYYGELGTNPYFRNGASGEEYSYISYKNLIDEIDFGMLRNAKYMYISVVDAVTGELYYEIAGADLAKTYFNANYGMIIPFYLLSSYGEVWDGTDAEGNYLPDGTTVTYRFDAWLDDGDEEMDDTWSFNVRIDDTNPELLNDNDLQSAMRVDGDRTYLTLEMLENEKIAAVIFISPNGTIMGKYAVENLPGEVLSQEFDITGFGGEFTIVVADYACNETEVDVLLDLGKLSSKGTDANVELYLWVINNRINQHYNWSISSTAIQKIFFQPQSLSQEYVLYTKDEKELKVSDFLSVLSYGKKFAEAFFGVESPKANEYVLAAKTVDLAINHQDVDKPLNKTLHIINDVLTEYGKDLHKDKGEKMVFSGIPLFVDLVIDFLVKA